MTFSRVRLSAVALLTLSASLSGIAGCGGGGGGSGTSVPVEQANTTTSKSELKARLSEIATTGAAGSSLAGMKESIEALKATDGPLAEGLLADLAKLETTTNETQIKSIAKEMAAKL